MSRASKREFRRWLPLSIVKGFVDIAADRGVSSRARSEGQFVDQYCKARGIKSRLSQPWRDARNRLIARHKASAMNERLWLDSGDIEGGRPSRRLLSLVMWAWVPGKFANNKLKRYMRAWKQKRKEEMMRESQDAVVSVMYSVGMTTVTGIDDLSQEEAADINDAVSVFAGVNGIEQMILTGLVVDEGLSVIDISNLDGEDVSGFSQDARANILKNLRWPPVGSAMRISLAEGAATFDAPLIAEDVDEEAATLLVGYLKKRASEADDSGDTQAMDEKVLTEQEVDPSDPWSQAIDGETSMPFVIHAVHHGNEMEHVLRLARDDESAIGWLLRTKNATAPVLDVASVDDAKSANEDSAARSLIDFVSGEFSRVQEDNENSRRINVSADKFSEHSINWLGVDGEVVSDITGEKPKVYLKVDEGLYEQGWQQPNAHEYFLSGNLSGKFLVRDIDQVESMPELQIQASVPDEPDGEVIPSSPPGAEWLMMQVRDQIPGIITDNAVEKMKVGAKGVSYLPSSIRKAIPEELQFWNQDEPRQRHEIRNLLVDVLKQSGGMSIIEETVFSDIDTVELSSLIASSLKDAPPEG